MASHQAPGDPGPSNPFEDEQYVSPQSSERGREKKRVGFASDTDNRAEPYGSPFQTPNESEEPAEDYFSLSPENENNRGVEIRESFNKAAVTAALANIFDSEHGGGGPVAPSKPRPVLRKQTLLDSPGDLVPSRSELAAKNRADRLAYDVGTSSAPVSVRSSVDLNASGTDTPFDGDSLLAVPGLQPRGTHAQDFAPHAGADGLRPRKRSHQAANDLVRTHTRHISPLSQPSMFPRSGTATPIPDDVEYVPQPTKYKGGILGNLLKLYNAEEKHAPAMGGTSGTSTPAGWTPNRTPASTPPTSRPGTPRPEKALGGLRGMRNSSSTLAGLVGSSFMFATPATKDISEAVSEKIRNERDRPKKRSRSKQRLEEFRITVHIAEIISRHQYLIKLCQALMMYGAPTHRLETYMRMSARVLGIEGQFMYLPGTMIISFDDSNTHTTEVKIVRSPQGVDLGRLRDVHEIYKEVVHDRIGVEEATTRLKEVIDRKRKFPTWLRVLLFGLASATVAPFGFEGRYIDMPICFLLGCLVGFLQLYLAPSNELYANVFEITAAVATSFMSRVFGSINNGSLFCFSALAQSSIALILPGYMVLCASLELQSHQMISGSVRMVYALIYSLFLGYGITIGSVIYGYIDENAVSEVHCRTGSEWYLHRPNQDFYILFVLPFTLCLCAINQAKWKQTPVMAFISLAGYVVNNFSSRHFQGNPTLSSSLGALCIGVLANLYSRLGQHAQNYLLDFWDKQLKPRTQRLLHRGRKPRRASFVYNDSSAYSQESVDTDDPEAGKVPIMMQRARKIGYGLAAAAMLPAIFVQVPSGLAVSGSLLSGVTSADQITRNETMLANGTVVNGITSTTTSQDTDLNSTAFNVLFSVIQVAISISVGLSLSALIVYPFGKRRSGLFSF
ncbi:hypothetical protein B0T16DRAFT_319932 [Cercophora newfieldiana]|uniref:Threonine/serine exporter-like N-terminal domain-containing protein n=1 Tax=Cercophora newfieldiana TaxID=92897 RepID=A0AA39YT33_9PEZI|nr:hypothetical protein B0T16DRAFT_319932 [Cercophora newfieldiana]